MQPATAKPSIPREGNYSELRSTGTSLCPFGKLLYPSRACQSQQECQTKMNVNGYCSEKGICCQGNEDQYDSLCYERRLPLFGEQRCQTEYDCESSGALCKSNHCCPNFHSAPNKPLRPPSHFYASNFSCVPGKPIPAGFQFAYCSNISRTISYVGVVNKCGNIQHITKHSKCKTDSDCFPGNICVWIVDEGTCFRNPEDCYKSTWYYVAIVSCFMSFVTMLLYFLTRTFYEHPEKVNEYLPHMSLFTYDITEKAKYEAFNIYGTEGMDIHQINAIVRNGTEKAWEEDEKSMDKPAFEHILNWFGYVIDYSDDDSDGENEEIY